MTDDSSRLTQLEMLVTHLERTEQTLDEAIQRQQKQIDQLERRLEFVVRELGTMRTDATEVRKPEDEKPPHY